MNNRLIGGVIILLALVSAYVTWDTNTKIAEAHQEACSCGLSCSMSENVPRGTIAGLATSIVLGAMGTYILRQKTVSEEVGERVKHALKQLKPDEKKVLGQVIAEKAVFQGDIVENTKLSKVKVSRILDRLEGRGLVERKRRGMANMVVLKGERN